MPSLAHPVNRFEPLLDRLRRVREKLWLETFAEETSPCLLRIEQKSVGHHGGIQLQVAVIDGVNLLAGAVQVAGKSEQLEEKNPLAVVGRVSLGRFELLLRTACCFWGRSKNLAFR